MQGTYSDIAVENPRTLAAALDLLADPEHAGIRPLAGGTEVFVLLNAGMLRERRFFNVLRIPQLRKIAVRKGTTSIGAAVSYSALMEHKAVRERFPALVEAARWTGGVQIQNRGTLAGNIVNASPAADSVPPLMAYDATLLLRSAARGERRVALGEFFLGYKKLDLAPDELLVAVELPDPPPRARHYFRKVGTRLAQAIAKVVLSGVIRQDKDGHVDHVRIVVGSVAPTTLRLRAIEDHLMGRELTDGVRHKAVEMFRLAIAPIDDIRSTRDYRLFAATNCFREFLEEGHHVALADLPVEGEPR